MPLDRLVLILVIVVVAAGATVWLGAMFAAILQVPAVAAFLLPVVGLLAYLVWRVVADRVGNAEDDHYDRIEK